MLITQAFDGAPIEELPANSEADIDRMLEQAGALYRNRSAWLPSYKRIEILRRLARLVQRDFEIFALLIAREGGKPLTDARIEATRAVNGIDGAASGLEHLIGTEVPMGLTSASENRLAFTTREPIGVVAALSAFNHPLNLIVHQVAPAIATGCPVIIKPASTTPLTCRHFVKLVHEAGLPPDWCQFVLPETNVLAERLATDPRVAFLSFIGSPTVGWYLRSKLPPGTRCALEHGGAAPVIVDRSASLEAIITPVVKGGYYHAGQVCVSVQRIFVHRDVKDEFLDRFRARVELLRVGDPVLPETEVGPLILPKEVTRVADWVNEAIGAGSACLTGGKAVSDRVYEPTILLEPPAGARVSSQEVFGPVTCVYGFNDIDEAIARANSLPFAFQAAVFATDINAALHSARTLEASAVMVNDHTAFRTDWMPFAGRRQSGYGTGGIPYTMRDMTQEKMIVLKV
jgi:acyl-CoA reductase-like NAD-dependent aldehyde dehydrogenase